MTPEFWAGKRVLITGHTGFKGAWLAAWLESLNAKVSGYAHAPEGAPNLWSLLGLEGRVASTIADINDMSALEATLARDKPEVVFHFAAQSLVRRSYKSPVETFTANVTGVVSLLDAIRRAPSVQAVVIATSDKCYENLERTEPYAEDDRFGGRDLYSASKGCAEIAAAAMRQSYFQPGTSDGHLARIATARAGNVIGGGDWSEDRLVPDIIRGCLGPDKHVIIRAPQSIRPWQHVLEPLAGYIALAEKLHSGDGSYEGGWNFGPGTDSERPVIDVAQGLVDTIGQGRLEVIENPDAPHEAKILRLDASKATRELGWSPVLDFSQTLSMTADWYAKHARGECAATLTRRQIQAFMQESR